MWRVSDGRKLLPQRIGINHASNHRLPHNNTKVREDLLIGLVLMERMKKS
jgi:hypothetical protein